MRLHGIISNQDIARIIPLVEQYLQRNGVEQKMRLAAGIALEEILLVYQNSLDETKAFHISIKKTFEEIRCIVTISGDSVDLCAKENAILYGLSNTAHLPIPSWQYINSCNQVVLIVPLFNTTLKNIKFVWSYVKKYRRTFFFAVGTQWINVLANIVAPILSARIIIAYTDSAFEQIILTALAIFATRLIATGALFLCNTKYNVVFNKLLSDIEIDLTHNSLQVTNACMRSKDSGVFIQRLTTDTEMLATGFNTVADMISQLLRYVGVMIAMALVSFQAFAFAIVILIVQIIIEYFRMKRMTMDERVQRQARENLSGVISEMVRGTSDVKTLNCENSFETEVSKRVKRVNISNMNTLYTSWKFRLTRSGVRDVGELGFLCLLAYLILWGKLAPANALVLFNYHSEIGLSVILVIEQLSEFLKNLNLSAERISAIINNPEFPKEKFGDKHLDSVRGEIRFDHVGFRYESPDIKKQNREILKDISFRIPAGSTAALVGKSGCGKTTIFRLLCKLYESTSGDIYLDGVNIKELDKESIRGNISVVNQDPYIFHMSIRDNLRLVKPDLTDEEMVMVCKICRLFDDIERMPQKYDSMIGEGGINLSGGQRQRLAIARCLLRNTPIVLMDEATSALDNVTQMEIMNAISEKRRNQTLVLIAHRLSTVVNADIILFVDDGKILDQGTHHELLTRCDAYRKLYETKSLLNQGS